MNSSAALNTTVPSTVVPTSTLKTEDDVNEPISNIQTGQKAQKEEQSSSMKIFFILIVLGWRLTLFHIFWLTNSVNFSFQLFVYCLPTF